MISLLKTAFEMERLQKFKKAALECYGQALTSIEQNVIEVDHRQATQFRQDLQMLVSQLSEAATPQQLQNIQDLFRGELQEYRDSTHEQLRRLRREMDAAVAALEEFAGNASARGDDHEKEWKRALTTLETAAASGLGGSDAGGDSRGFRGHSFRVSSRCRLRISLLSRS